MNTAPGPAASLVESATTLDGIPVTAVHLTHDYTSADGSTLQTTAPLSRLGLSAGESRLAIEMARGLSEGAVIVDAPYQRGQTWELAQRQGLVKSWLSEVPIPSIIVNDRCTTKWHAANGTSPLDDGVGMYAVVDGRQRVECAAAWFNSEFGVPASWFEPDCVASTFETPDGPYVTHSHLSNKGQNHMRFHAKLPQATAQFATVEEEAAMYLLVNGGGVAQTDDDMTRAADVAAGTTLI